MSQLDLGFVDLERQILGLIARIVSINGGKVVADALGISESHLSHALARRKNAAIRAEKLGVLVQLEGGDALVELLARLIGKEPIDAMPPSASEQLLATHQVLTEQLGPMVRKGLKRAVDKRVRDNRAVVRATGG